MTRATRLALLLLAFSPALVSALLVRLAVPDVCLDTIAGFEPSYMTTPLPCDPAGRIALAARERIVELAEATSSAAEISRRLRDLGITHLLWNFAEADRIAHAAGRDDFLDCPTPQGRRRLDLFLAGGVTTVAKGRGWKIAALRTD